MKINLTVFLIGLFLISCNQNSNNKIDSGNNITNDSTTYQNIEKNLKEQLNKYYVDIIAGNTDTALNYMYPDIFTYDKTQYPYYSLAQIKDTISENMKSLKRMIDRGNLKVEYKMGDITKKIDLGNDKIYIIKTPMVIKSKDKEKTSFDVCIAITKDKGKIWTFMSYDTILAPPVLRMKFSDDVIKQIMSDK